MGVAAAALVSCHMFCVDCQEGSSGDANAIPPRTAVEAFDYRVTNVDDGAVIEEGCGVAWTHPDTRDQISVRANLWAEYALELTNIRIVRTPEDMTGFDACAQTEFTLYPYHEDPACYKTGPYGIAFELLEAVVIDAAGDQVLSTTGNGYFPAEPGDRERFRIRPTDYGSIEISRSQPPCGDPYSTRALMSFASP
jgi:hypothetical protein